MIKVLSLFVIILFIVTACSDNNNQNNEKLPRQDLAFQIFNEAKNETDLDKKLVLLSKALNKIKSLKDTLLFDIIDYKIYYHDVQKNYDSSLHYSNLMINNAVRLKDTSSLAKGYYRKARIFLYLENHEQVLKNMYQSQSLYKTIGDSVNTGRRLVELANAQDRLGDFTASHQSATDALKFLSHNDSIYQSIAHNLIAITNSKLQDFDEAIIENNNALKYAGSTEDSLAIFNNLAMNYRRNGNYKKSNEYLIKAINKASDSSKIARILYDNYYYNQYLESGKNVVQDLEKIATQREALNDIEGLINSYNHLSSIYKNTYPIKSKEYAEKYLAAASRFGNPTDKLEALKILITLEDGKRKSEYASEYFHLNDSINNARAKIKNVFAKIKYDEGQKIKQIENLEQISANRKLELAKEKTQKTIILFVLIILILVTIFVYYLIKQKHKKARIKEVYSTEARLSKKVHDELANDIFQIMTQLNGTTPEIINRLESVYHRTRDISKENSLINTSENFQDELRGMINGAIPSNTKTILSGFQNIKWDFYKKEQKIVIYRSIQELLVNFRKHSEANLLVLKFEEKKSKLKITYKDNGIGTDLERKKFSGLQNMENRISSIGGNITFQSEIQNGFMSTIYIPI